MEVLGSTLGLGPGVSVCVIGRSASCVCWEESDCLEIGIVWALERVRLKEGVIEWERLLISKQYLIESFDLVFFLF